MKHLFKQPLFYTTVISLLALGLIIASYVFGWNPPTQPPPNGNITLQTGASPAGSAGYIQFNAGSGALGGDANLFWDNTNKRLGIGTTTPQNALDIIGNLAINSGALVLKPSATPTAQKGTIYYDQTTDTFKGYQGSGWVNIYTGSQTGYVISTVQGATAATAAKSAADTILISPIFIPFTINVNNFLVQVTTALGATGDVGLYNSNGTLLLNGGSGSLTTATGIRIVVPMQTGSARLIPPGQYYVAVTWNSTTGVIAGANVTNSGFIPRSGTISGGGSVLPSSLNLANITPTNYIYAVTLTGDTKKENGAICSAASDCLSGYCYIDNDGDGYAGSSGTAYCRAIASKGTDCNDSCATCYPGSTAYTTSPDGLDQDCDGTVDNIVLTKYYLYTTASVYTGNLGGRTGADNKCNLDSNKPSTCGSGWAFISVNSSDEIRDMPTTKSINTNSAWYFKSGSASAAQAATSWANLLDGSVDSVPSTGGLASVYWTGSGNDGSLSTDYCAGWTDQSNSYAGRRGYNANTSNWLDSGTNGMCYLQQSVLCACAENWYR
jgi:hypothetical protein